MLLVLPRTSSRRFLSNASSQRAVLGVRSASDACFPTPDIQALLLFPQAFAQVFPLLHPELLHPEAEGWLGWRAAPLKSRPLAPSRCWALILFPHLPVDLWLSNPAHVSERCEQGWQPRKSKLPFPSESTVSSPSFSQPPIAPGSRQHDRLCRNHPAKLLLAELRANEPPQPFSEATRLSLVPCGVVGPPSASLVPCNGFLGR